MSGVAIIGELLASNAALTATVPAARIVSGPVRLKTALPAISITKIGGQQHNSVAMASRQLLVTERVQVMVMADDHAEVQQVLDLVRGALPLSRGVVKGFICQGIIPDTEGPDIFDPEILVHFQSLDFVVNYTRLN